MKNEHKADVVERINALLLRMIVLFSVVYFLLLLRSQAFSMDLSFKGQLPFSGELSIKGTGLDKEKDRISRIKEFSSYPDSGISLSTMLMREGKQYRFNLSAKDIGENDVSALLSLDIGKWAITDTTYEKIPHVTSLTDFTLRSTNALNIRILPLNFVSVPVQVKEEDKIGRYESTNPVGFYNIGQKEKYLSAGVDAAWKCANFSFNYETSRLKQLQIGSELKSTTVLLQNAQDVMDSYAALSYNTTDIKSEISGVNDIELRKWELEASHSVTDAVSVEGYYESNKRTNKNTNVLSTNAKSYFLSAGYQYTGQEGSPLKSADVSLGYAKDTADYTNAGIANEDVKTWNVSGKAKFNFLSLKADYEKSDKDVSGITAARLVNFNELSSSSKSWGASISSKPALKEGQLSASYYLKRNVTEPKPVTGYGVASYRTNLNGVTLTYLLSPKVTVNYNWTLTEWRKSGVFAYRKPALTVETASVFDNNEFHQGTLHFTLSEKTAFSAGYWESNSSSYDFSQDIKAREQEFNLSGQHSFKDDLTLSLELKRNVYKDPSNSISNGQTNLVEIEVIKKF